MTPSFATPAQGGGVFLAVRAKPRSSKPGVEPGDGELIVRVSSAPADGAANEELIATLADALGAPKSSLTLVRGALSRHKRVLAKFDGVEDAVRRLGGVL